VSRVTRRALVNRRCHDGSMGARSAATHGIGCEVLDEEELLDAAIPHGRASVDPSQHLGLAITELMGPRSQSAWSEWSSRGERG
jgi:hypothetical protein